MQELPRLNMDFLKNLGIVVTALIVFAAILGIVNTFEPNEESVGPSVNTVPTYRQNPTATRPPTAPSALVEVATPTDTPRPSPTNTPRPTPTAMQVPPTPSPTDTPLPYPVASLTAYTYLYSGPGADYTIVDKALTGNTFRISGKNAAGDWLQIEIAIGSVWIYAPFVQVEGPIDSIGVIGAYASTPTPFPTFAYSYSSADAQAPPIQSSTETQSSYPVARLTADMNLRSGPGIDFPIVGAAAAGNTFRITGRIPADDWWQIEAVAGTAWVYALFVQVEGPIESLGYTAVLPPPPVSTSTPFPTLSPTLPSHCPINCFDAHEMRLSNMTQDHQCYRTELDYDDNGIACERRR